MKTAQSIQSSPNSSLSEPIQAISRPINVGSFIKSQTTIQGYAGPKISSNYENMNQSPQRSFLDYGPVVDLYSTRTTSSKYLKKSLIYSLKNPSSN